MSPPRLAVQFQSLEVQAHAARLGMWLFLASELLLFGGLFALYAAYRILHGADFLAAAGHNSRTLGTVNTVVLISSSFTVAMAVHAMRGERPRRAALLLGLTILLALGFLAVKAIEYRAHIAAGILPGVYYRAAGPATAGAHTFFTLYYFMTGLHGLHVVGGMAALSWLTRRAWRRLDSAQHHVPLELGALYWHLVDLVWIFLWPLLYLAH